MHTRRAYSPNAPKNRGKLCMLQSAAGFDPAKPYNHLPTLPPSSETETKAVLRRCVTAGRALATLRQTAKLIPNQDVLINTIPLREAKDSSAIENIVTTNDKLFRFANVDPD